MAHFPKNRHRAVPSGSRSFADLCESEPRASSSGRFAVGWWIAWGIPWDPRFWAAFFLHDLGYLSCNDVEGPEGEEHVRLGAKIMGLLFGSSWADFTLRHSRYWAKKHGVTVSKLCYADKLAFVLTPGWPHLPMARATGELAEYMAKSRDRQAGCASFTAIERTQLESADPRVWLQGLQNYTQRWVEQHRNGNPDTWIVVRGDSAEESWIGTE